MTQIEIRQSILQKRKSLTAEEVAHLSQAVIERFLTCLPKLTQLYLRHRNIAVFRSVTGQNGLSGELDISSLIPHFEANGMRVYYPRVSDYRAKKLEFVEIPTDGPWVVSRYGIPEPHPQFLAAQPDVLDWVFVPGVAFGPKGERIGMGAGFYDRFLKETSNALRIALAFDFQVLEGIPQQPWDEKMDWVFTDRQSFQAFRQRS